MTKLPPRIGVVLSSGGVRGVYAHTGFMQAIHNLGIPVAAGAGCSAGALVGGFMASGTPLEQWLTSLQSIHSRTFWTPDSLPRFLWKMTVDKGCGYAGLSGIGAALGFVRDHLAVSSFEACRYPFHTLAINLGSGDKMVFSEGELAPRMIASAAMPILYAPVEINGEYYCDGALIDFAPTDAICCRHHLDVVIVHHVSQHFGTHRDIGAALRDKWAMLEVVNRLVFRAKPWYLSGEALTMRYCPCGCGAVIVAVEPDLPTMGWPGTEGGADVQLMAKEQAESILRPYLASLLDAPRRQLPALAVSDTHPIIGCGRNEV